jgi:hypothetical protein
MYTVRTLFESMQDSGKFNVSFCGPYYNGDKGTPITGDWNGLREALGNDRWRKLENRAESRGFELRFDDEVISDDNGKTHELNPGFHGQSPTYYICSDSYVMARDEAEQNPEMFLEQLFETGSYAHKRMPKGVKVAGAVPNGWQLDLSKLGFTRFEYEAESGLHPGQTDTPAGVVAKLIESGVSAEGLEVVPVIDDVGQFDVRWVVWYRQPTEEVSEEESDVDLSEKDEAA